METTAEQNRNALDSGWREVGLLFACLFSGVLLSAFLAPWIFNGLTHLGRSSPPLFWLRELTFERVSTRASLVGALLGLLVARQKLPLLRDPVAWGFRGHIAGPLGWGIGIGIIMMGIVVTWGLGSGAFKLHLSAPMRLFFSSLLFLGGALIVGLLEETICRGIVYTILRKPLAIVPASLVTSLLFATLHFLKPEPLVGVVHASWYSGVQMLGEGFRWTGFVWSSGFFFLTLFFMSMTLCFLLEGHGSLYPLIGLHAGWVWMLRLASQIGVRQQEVHLVLFGPSKTLSKSGLVCLMTVAMTLLTGIWLVRRRKAGCDS